MVSYLQIDDLTKSFGDLILFEQVTFGIVQGQKCGLIAPNGAGKTTLLSIIAGREDYDSGSVVFRKDLHVGYLEQMPRFTEGQTVLQACLGKDIDNAEKELRARQMLSILEINDFTQKVETLSGGQIKRVAVVSLLISDPELIILDEPTNHLDLETTEWLENYLDHSNITILMVTHDRYFLDRVCDTIFEIDQRHLYQYRGNYQYYLEKRQERLDAQSVAVDRAKNLMRKELDWMRRQPQARGSKAKYRIDAFYDLEKKAKAKAEDGSVSLNVKASYIGSKIFEAKHVTKSFGDKCITNDFNYQFARYEKLGITGHNGTGKSTFIRMLLGLEKTDSGGFDVGSTVRFGYYSQDGLQFDEQMQVLDVVRDIAETVDIGDGTRLSVASFLNYFLFPPEKQRSFVYKLSGGERRRLYLCTVLMRNPNFLVLDEPTNDLDIMTLNVLEDYLASFRGCVIVISHDRFFMDKVVDHLMIFHGGGNIQDFPGNYSQYRFWKEMRDEEEKKILPTEKNQSLQQTPRRQEERRPRMTFSQRREYEALNEEIPRLEAEKKAIEESMSNSTLAGDELLKQSHRFAQLLEEIEIKSNRWLELGEIEE